MRRGRWAAAGVGYAGDGLTDGAADGGGAGRQLEGRVAVGTVNQHQHFFCFFFDDDEGKWIDGRLLTILNEKCVCVCVCVEKEEEDEDLRGEAKVLRKWS